VEFVSKDIPGGAGGFQGNIHGSSAILGNRHQFIRHKNPTLRLKSENAERPDFIGTS
jgi:hypothetical protein